MMIGTHAFRTFLLSWRCPCCEGMPFRERARKYRVSQGRWRSYLFLFGFLETYCHSSRPSFVGIQMRCAPCCHFCSSAEIIPVLRNSPDSYEISALGSRMKTALLTLFYFCIKCPQRVFRTRSSPKIVEWSHLIPTQKRRKSRGLRCLSVHHYQSICMPRLKWPMKTTFPMTNRWVWFHWIRARNDPETRNVHCLRMYSQQCIILLRFKWCFLLNHPRCSRNRRSVNCILFRCEFRRNREVCILCQWVDIDSFSRLGWSDLPGVLLFLIAENDFIQSWLWQSFWDISSLFRGGQSVGFLNSAWSVDSYCPSIGMGWIR
jgi:hypothetical protein